MFYSHISGLIAIYNSNPIKKAKRYFHTEQPANREQKREETETVSRPTNPATHFHFVHLNICFKKVPSPLM